MRPQTVTVASATTSAPIPMDRCQGAFGVSFAVVMSGTLTYKVQHTLDDILGGATATWFDHTTVTGKSANADGNYAYPVTAIRLNITAYTNGTATMTVLQGGES